ncbi:MAG: hypothetical protein WCP95_10820 [Actinomycetes bacterium]
MQDDPYTDVPDVEEDAEVDPYWLELRNDSTLPQIYMPPAMAGRYTPTHRIIAAALIGVFVLGTALGICLTYGPQVLGW